MARSRSRIRGAKSFRRTMKQLPDAVKAQMGKALEQSGPEIKARMEARIAGTTRRRTGKLLGGVKVRVLKASLRLRVGFLGTPTGRAKLFYARILEFGRKAQTVTVSRRKAGVNSGLIGGRKQTKDIAATYKLRVRAIQPKRFVTSKMTDLRVALSRRLNGIWERSLRSIAGGADD